MTDLDKLRYPVGKFERVTPPLDRATRAALVKTIEDTPRNHHTVGVDDATLRHTAFKGIANDVSSER